MATNPALVRMLGYDSEDELMALDLARDIYADAAAATSGVRTMAESARCATPKWSSQRKDGTGSCARNRGAVRDSDGKVLFYEGTLTDITAGPCTFGAAVPRREPRSAHGPQEPPRVRGTTAARARATHATGHACRLLPGPRPLRSSTTPAATSRATSCCGSSATAAVQLRSADVVARFGGDESPCCCRTVARTTRCRSRTRPQGDLRLPVRLGAALLQLGISIGVVIVTRTSGACAGH